MGGVDDVLAHGLERIRDVVKYYVVQLEKTDLDKGVEEVKGGNEVGKENRDGEDEDANQEEGDSKDEDEGDYYDGDEEDGGDSDDDGGDSDMDDHFVESMLAKVYGPATDHEGGVSDQLRAIQKWSASQHLIPWSQIRQNVADGVWHTAYQRYKSWHLAVKRKAGDDSGDEYVDHMSKRARTVSQLLYCLDSSPSAVRVHLLAPNSVYICNDQCGTLVKL